MSSAKRIAGFLIATTLLLGSAGCRNQNRLIEKVTFTPSENLEVLQVALVFTPRIQTSLQAQFAVKDYGLLFLDPYVSEESPFRLGFELDTDVVNEQDYVNLEPTLFLPNGMPIGLPHPVVEVRGEGPIHDKFDVYGYVDVLHASWLGVAGIFDFMNPEYFPPGLTLSQVFLRNDDGDPGVIAHVFGPVVRGGEVERRGGIGLFANARQLIEEIRGLQPGETLELTSGEPIEIMGPAAPYYENSPRRLLELEERLIEGMNR